MSSKTYARIGGKENNLNFMLTCNLGLRYVDDVQWKLLNSKSSRVFRINRSLNYREVDIKLYITPKIIIIIFLLLFFSIKHKFWAPKRKISMSRFFCAPKTYVIIDCRSIQMIMNWSYSLNSMCSKFILN